MLLDLADPVCGIDPVALNDILLVIRTGTAVSDCQSLTSYACPVRLPYWSVW